MEDLIVLNNHLKQMSSHVNSSNDNLHTGMVSSRKVRDCSGSVSIIDVESTTPMLRGVLLALAVCMASACLEPNWEVFKAKYNKTIPAEDEIPRRYYWKQNMKTIDEHNKLFATGLKSYYLKEVEFADWKNMDLNPFKYGFKSKQNLTPGNYVSGQLKHVLPSSVDWRKKGYVTRVKDQLMCGCSWAFSATGALEGQLFKQTGKLVELSESNLVDCSSDWGNEKRHGGLMNQTFQYVIANKGINTEASYPYVDEVHNCRFNSTDVVAQVKSFNDVVSGCEDSLMQAVATVGPISVAIDASGPTFRFYGGGVYDEPDCSTTELNHAVLVVGYGTLKGKDYWLVKNSWGTDFGLDGYILMSRNKKNQCGIATAASYPVM